MHRILHKTLEEETSSCILDAEASHHLTAVLRARAGDALTLTNGNGLSRRAVYEGSEGRRVRCRFTSDAERSPRETPEIILFQCIAKSARMDWLVEKAAEMGVSRIVPLISRRCSVKLRPGERVDRWARIAVSALEQCDSPFLTEVCEPQYFSDAVGRGVPAFSLAGIIGGNSIPILSALAGMRTAPERIHWFVGPEGDFDPEESAALINGGAVPVSLGKNILRVETAALFGISAIKAFCDLKKKRDA